MLLIGYAELTFPLHRQAAAAFAAILINASNNTQKIIEALRNHFNHFIVYTIKLPTVLHSVQALEIKVSFTK